MPAASVAYRGFIVRHRQEQRNYACNFRALWNEDKVMQPVREERLTFVIQRIVFDELLERRWAVILPSIAIMAMQDYTSQFACLLTRTDKISGGVATALKILYLTVKSAATPQRGMVVL